MARRKFGCLRGQNEVDGERAPSRVLEQFEWLPAQHAAHINPFTGLHARYR